MVDTKVTLCGHKLSNPVIPASGTFGFGEEMREYYDLNILGAISLKGTTLNPRFGNDAPRIAECSSGLLNAVGLQNPGIDIVLSHEIPRLRAHYKNTVILNLSGFSPGEYEECCRKADTSSDIDIIEVNISCPNVHGGGMSFGADKDSAALITKSVKAATKKPVFIKLSPNVTNIAEIAKSCEAAGADGISLINTLLGMRIDKRKKAPLLANTTGGLSGPCVFPVAVRMVYEVYKAVKIPIIGMGGVSSAEDVVEMMLAGASAVQVGAANLVNPYACKEIIEDLPRVMEKYNISSLSEMIGGAH